MEVGVHASVEADAVVVVSELVSNAMRHGGGCLELGLSTHEDQVTVSAADGSAVIPRRRDPDDHGRGLRIIEAFSQRWGVESHEDGKHVWILLAPYPRVEVQPTPDF
ncbi:MAG TPA: ATP-binding protein [Propionibacteriaceae bacterium]|nr:ATP-binding protein [Propionibacteriaceae bacterium]